MSRDARDFNNMEMRAVIKFFLLQGKAPKENHAILKETLWEHTPSYATIKNWVAQSSEQLLEFFRRDPNDFLLPLVTMDETWL